MADLRENVFQMLDDEDAASEAPAAPATTATASLAPISAPITSTLESSDNNNNSWTDVSSTRTRRLAPQCTLTKQDFAAENPRTPKAQGSAQETDKIAKKKVARHPRDELLSLRRRSKLLPEMADITDIVSIEPLEPECWKGITAEEILRLWSTGNDRPQGAGRGRGRGRGRQHDNGLEEDGDNGGDMWDDCGDAAEGLDLADFAAATLKFSSESKQVTSHGGIEDEEDVMESLMKEEQVNAAAKVAKHEEYVAPVLSSESTNKFKSSLLMQALQPEKAPEVAKPPAPLSVSPVETLLSSQTTSAPFSASLLSHDAPSSSPEIAIKAKSLLAPPPAPQPAPVMEWLYRDPQNNIQGPFDNTSMRRWLECGYFKENLPIKLSSWRDFHPLGEVFANPSVAFRTVVPNEPASSFPFPGLASSLGALASPASRPTYDPILADTFQFSIPAAEILQNKPVPVTQPVRSAVHWESDVAAPSEVIQGASPVVRPEVSKIDVSKIAVPENKSSILLPVTPITKPDKVEEVAPALPSSPLERVPEVTPMTVEDSETPAPAAQPKKSKKKEKSVSTAPAATESAAPVVDPNLEIEKEKPVAPKAPAWGKTEKTQVSLKQIQEEESKRREAEPPAPPTMSSQLKSLLGVGGTGKGGSVWGVKTSSGPSLLEIQEQQKSQSQEAETVPSSASTSSKWNTAATTVSLTDIMSEEAKKTTAAPKGPAPTSWAAKAVTGLKPEPPRAMAPTPSYAAPAAPPKKSVAQTAPAASAPKPVQIMSRSGDSTLEWCNQQLKKIKGDEAYDLTLIEYCMSLDSAIEIREIFAQYLGSTPQVSHFATEFIRRKEGKPVSSTMPISGPAPAAEVKKPSNQFVVAGKKKKKASA